MQCRFHPDKEARIHCQKMDYYYCEECLENCQACTDPCAYCKFRQGCIIWEQCRKEAKRRCQEERQASGPRG